MALENVINKHQRLSILLALNAMAGLETNDSLLQCSCGAYGHNISRDKLRSQLAWLSEQGYVSLKESGGYQLVTLTERGQDIATGNANDPGVKRPGAK